MTFAVAVVQMPVVAGRVDENRRVAVQFAQTAVAGGAKLVLFPEACVSDIYHGAQLQAETIPGPSTEALARVAGEALIALPLLERATDGKTYSACALVSGSGVRGVARKTHLWRDPQGHDTFHDGEVMSAGAEVSVFDCAGVRVGVLLGFDAEFPEAFRTLVLRGADVIVVAQNCLAPELAFFSAMARRNCVPVLVANRLGFRAIYPAAPEASAFAMPIIMEQDGSAWLRCRGDSAILDELGHSVAQPRGPDAPQDEAAPERVRIPARHFQEAEILTAALDLETVRARRQACPFLTERRPAVYEP